MRESAPSVEVLTVSVGRHLSAFSRAYVDEDGQLVVSNLEGTHASRYVFWRECICHSGLGHVTRHYINPNPMTNGTQAQAFPHLKPCWPSRATA